MPAVTTTQDTEVIEKRKDGGTGNLPPVRGHGGNGGSGGEGKNQPGRRPSPNRYYTGIAIAIVSVLMFFMALASAFLVRKGGADWVPVHIPLLLWVNTAVLLASSFTLQLARKRLADDDSRGFRNFWLVTTVLGVCFLIGQLLAWRILVRQGVYLASNPASSFFYIFTGAHAVHLLGGVGALVYVALRNFDAAKVTRTVAADVTSYFWHFLDGLWVFLLVLLYLGK
jgi:cytochrome c oxidase subunit III